MDEFTSMIDRTMQKSLLVDLRSYLCLNNYDKFVIYSDYCLEDKNKLNDVASFTVAPAWTIFPEVANKIQNAISVDIKKRRFISDKTIGVLKNRCFFHINFILKDMAGLTISKSRTGQEVALKNVDEAIDMIRNWIPNQPEGADKFQDQIKKLQYWREELQKKSPNLKLYRQITLISFLAAYIAHMLTVEANANTIVWFSDRDKITEAYQSVVFDLFEINHYGLCDYKGVEGSITKIGLGIKDEGSNDLWYDPLIRIPDYLAGTLSSWDMSVNLVSGNKHVQMLEQVFCENEFCVIIELNVGRGNWNCGRRTISFNK